MGGVWVQGTRGISRQAARALPQPHTHPQS